jgi:hypothetical protein
MYETPEWRRAVPVFFVRRQAQADKRTVPPSACACLPTVCVWQGFMNPNRFMF